MYENFKGGIPKPLPKDKPKRKPLKRAAPKRQSIKQLGIIAKLAEVKKILTEKAIHEGKFFCWGCKAIDKPLSWAHAVSLKRCDDMAREDLKTAPYNLFLLCWGDNTCCHDCYDSGAMENKMKIDCFAEMLKVVEENDYERFHKMSIAIQSIKTGL